jgi:hypothetical protein
MFQAVLFETMKTNGAMSMAKSMISEAAHRSPFTDHPSLFHFPAAEIGENSRKGNLRTFRCLDTASPSCDCEVHFKLTRLIAASLTCVILEGD